MKWVKEGKKIFVNTGEENEYSHFGWGDIRQQFHGYMVGYCSAAHTLIEDAVESMEPYIIDKVIFPVCFLYRQYLELAMKNILIYYTEDDRERTIQNIRMAQHNLMKTWNLIEKYMKESATDKELQDIKAARGYIKQFNDFDKSSFTFRYPVDKNLNGMLDGEKRINLVVLKESMEEMYNFFEGVEGKLYDVKRWKDDLAREFSEEYY